MLSQTEQKTEYLHPCWQKITVLVCTTCRDQVKLRAAAAFRKPSRVDDIIVMDKIVSRLRRHTRKCIFVLQVYIIKRQTTYARMNNNNYDKHLPTNNKYKSYVQTPYGH